MPSYAVGKSALRLEDSRLLKGHGRFTDDLNLPHQAFAHMVRSPYAHAEIGAIDASAALSLPGVVAVLNGADYEADGLGSITGPSPLKRRDGSAMYRPPRPAISSDRVRHVGQIVAIVIAENQNVAKDAADLIEVNYNVLPSNVETAKAMEVGSPTVWEACPQNEAFFYQAGDSYGTDAAIRSARYVIKQRFVINRVSGNPIEPRGAVVHYDTTDDSYTIYAGIQRPYACREHLSKNLFKIPENRLRLVTTDVGGSFGVKGAIYPEIPLTAWASRRLGRPIKWRCDRTEGFLADDHARDNVSDVELALDANHKFVALRVRTVANLGAYVAFNGHGPPTDNIGGLAGVYRIPHMHVAVSGVFTNTSPLSPYRGAGRPEASYVLERIIDIAAHELPLDPAELRRRNLIPQDAMPYTTALTYTYDCGEFDKVMEKALHRADYAGTANRRVKSNQNGKLRGIGVSCTIEIAARPELETAELRFHRSGSATLLVGTTNHGQGHETIYRQVLCEVLGLPPDAIRVVEGDTDKVPFGTGTGGSRSAAIGSTAVLQAARKVLQKARTIAASLLEAAEKDLLFEEGKFIIAGTDRSIGFIDVINAAFTPGNLPKGLEPGLNETAIFLPPAATFPNACHVCEVEITPETGHVEILRYTAVDDCGVEINPLLVRGQVHGGIVQGVGQALMENMLYEIDTGQLLSGSFMDYAMPRANDVPNFDIGAHPVPTKQNPLGVKGVGESGTVGALAAVMNAINDALSPIGIRHLEMPATSQNVWKVIQEASNRAPSIDGMKSPIR